MHRAPDPQQLGLRELEGSQGAGSGDQADLYRPSAEAAQAELEAFESGPWGNKFPTVAAAWRRAWDKVIPFFAFPADVRKVIYTTNFRRYLTQAPDPAKPTLNLQSSSRNPAPTPQSVTLPKSPVTFAEMRTHSAQTSTSKVSAGGWKSV